MFTNGIILPPVKNFKKTLKNLKNQKTQEKTKNIYFLLKNMRHEPAENKYYANGGQRRHGFETNPCANRYAQGGEQAVARELAGFEGTSFGSMC